MNYSEQLTNEKWISKRGKILKRDHYKCVKCKSEEELNVHHKYYVRGKKAWEYPNNALVTFCCKCHKEWHDKHNIEIRDAVWKKNREYITPHKKPRKDRVQSEKKKKKTKVINSDYKYRTLDEVHKRKLKIRDEKKIKLIKEYTENYQEIFEKTRSLTLEELKEILIN